MKNNDIEIAQKIVGGSYSNYKDKLFHDSSIIYKKSNERINLYQKYLEDRKNVLSVIASSDQIINSILSGTKNLDTFDISRFPKYYMFLKLAGAISLDRDSYIDFFYNGSDISEKYDDMYFDLIRPNLSKENKEFWDSLFHFYDWYEINNSPLFSSEPLSITDVLRQNKYLEKENYKKLKHLIENVNISTNQGNILSLINTFNKNYDLAYFSNIIYYVSRTEYKKMLEKLNLSDDGIALTYLYEVDDRIKNFFNEENYRVGKFEESNAGVLVYKK